MDGICRDIKDALPDKLDSNRNVKKVEQSLRTSLAALQDQQNDDKCLLLLKSGIMYLIKVLHLLTCSVPLVLNNNILNLILDNLTSASDHGSKSNSFLVSSITDQCLDVVLNDKFAFLSRIEVLNKLNLIFESSAITVKENILQSETCRMKLKHLFQLVLSVGDYEFQVCIVEYLFRLLPRKLRQKYSKHFIEDPQTLQAFLSVKDSRFEVDCRKFLNHLNKCLGDQKKVYSFPCSKIIFGHAQLQKPCDDGYDDFWMDINTGSKRILIFCENAQLSSQASTNEDCWDTVSVWKDDVDKCVCQEKNGKLFGTVHLKSDATCIPRGWDHSISRLLQVVVHKEHDLEAAFFQVFGQEKFKVSDVVDPVQCFTVSSPKEHFSQDMSEMEDEDDEDESSSEEERVIREKHLINTCTGQSKGVKVSTPSNCIIVGSFDGFENIRVDTRKKITPVAQTSQPKKKVKTPVVTVQQPFSNSTSAITRRTVKTNFSSPRHPETNPMIQKHLSPKAVSKEKEAEQAEFVIPDSLPTVSYSAQQEPLFSGSKTQAVGDSCEISVTDHVHKPSTSESSKAQKSKSGENLEKPQDVKLNTGRNLRSSQNKTTSSSALSQTNSHLSASGRRTSDRQTSKLPEVCAYQETSADNTEMGKEPECVHTIPSSIEEFKAQRTNKTKTPNPSSSKQNSFSTEMSRKKATLQERLPENSTDDQKLKQSGTDRDKTKNVADNVLRDGTNSLNIPNKRKKALREYSLCSLTKPMKTKDKTSRTEQSLFRKQGNVNSSDINPQSPAQGQKYMDEHSKLYSSSPKPARNTRNMHCAKINASYSDKTPGSKVTDDSKKDVSKDCSQTQQMTSKKVMQSSRTRKGDKLDYAESVCGTVQKKKRRRCNTSEDHRAEPPDKQIIEQNKLLQMSELREPVTDKEKCDASEQETETSIHSARKMSHKQSQDKRKVSSLSHETGINCLQKSRSFTICEEQSDRYVSDSTNTETHSKKDSSSSKIHSNCVFDNFESDGDDSAINYRFEIESNAEEEDKQNEYDINKEMRKSQKQIHNNSGHSGRQKRRKEPETFKVIRGQATDQHETMCQNNGHAKTHSERKVLCSGQDFDETEANEEGASSNYDNENFLFNSNTSEENSSKVKSVEKPCRNKLNSTQTNEEVYSNHKSNGKITVSHFMHEEKQKENTGKPQKTTKKNAKVILTNNRTQGDMNYIHSQRNLRKRQPKSYKEVDDSEEDLEVIDSGRPSLQKHDPSRLYTDGKSFLLTPAKQTMYQSDQVCRKTYTLSISSTTHTKNMNTDPYSFEEQMEYAEKYGKTATEVKQYNSFLKSKSQKSVKKSKTTNQLKNITTPQTFSWDVDDDNNDPNAETSQENRRQSQVNYWHVSSIGGQSSLLPIQFSTPDPTQTWSGDSQDHASPRLFFSQKKKSKERTSFETFGGVLNTSPLKQKKSKESQKHGYKVNPVEENKLKASRNKTSEKSSFHLSDSDADTVVDKKSELSWICKRKTITGVDHKVKTYKRKPGSPLSPENGLSLAINKHKSTGDSSQVDSVLSSPELAPITPRHCSKKMYSLDIMLGPDVPDMERDNFDTSVKTSSKSKTSVYSALTQRMSFRRNSLSKHSLYNQSLVEKSNENSGSDVVMVEEASDGTTKSNSRKAVSTASDTGSQESRASERSKKTQHKQLQAVTEFSPSPTSNTLTFVGGKAASVKHFSKVANKFHKMHLDDCEEVEREEEEEDEEVTMRDLKRKGLISGPSSIARPSKSALKRTYGDWSGSDTEEEDEDISLTQSGKRRCLQPKQLFPEVADNLPDSTKEELQKNSKLQVVEIDQENCHLPSVSTDEFLSQPEIELEEPATGLSTLDSVAGLATLLKGHGFDLQKHMKEKESQVQDLAKNAFKLVSKQAKQIFTTDQNKREKVLSNFKGHIHRELLVLEQDIAGLNTIEKKSEATYLEQMKVLCEQREKLQQRVRTVTEHHKNFRLETEQINDQSDQSQRCLETQMKREMGRLKTKMLLDMQQQQLQKIKESLRKHVI